jgi:hypothetical protein
LHCFNAIRTACRRHCGSGNGFIAGKTPRSLAGLHDRQWLTSVRRAGVGRGSADDSVVAVIAVRDLAEAERKQGRIDGLAMGSAQPEGPGRKANGPQDRH